MMRCRDTVKLLVVISVIFRIRAGAVNESSSEATTAADHVHFIAPVHQWHTKNDNSATLDGAKTATLTMTPKISARPANNEAQLSKLNDLLSRRKRKVIHRGGYYILKSKSSWGSPSGHSPGSYQRRSPGPSSGGWSSRSGMGRGEYGPNGGRSRGGGSGGRRGGNAERERNGRKKINRNLKMEIGQYALQKGAKEAAEQYATRVGRKLRDRIIEKFARRYRNRKERKSKRSKDGKKRHKDDGH